MSPLDHPEDVSALRAATDLRLARPDLPIHSDPIVWAPGDGASRVALHLINALFGVPQVSVDLLAAAPEQLDALRFWLGFWRRHRDTILHGPFRPERPDLDYPVIRTGIEDQIVARFGPVVIPLPQAERWSMALANGDDSPVVLTADVPVTVSARVTDPRGRTISERELLITDAAVVDVPLGGLLETRRGRGASAPAAERTTAEGRTFS